MLAVLVDVLEMLIDWTIEGLDVNRAVAQPETAYKVRHLKMGIRVAGTLCSCDSYIAFRMLVSRSVRKNFLFDMTLQFPVCSDLPFKLKLPLFRWFLDFVTAFHSDRFSVAISIFC